MIERPLLQFSQSDKTSPCAKFSDDGETQEKTVEELGVKFHCICQSNLPAGSMT